MSSSYLRCILLISLLSTIVACSANVPAQNNLAFHVDFTAVPVEAEISQPIRFNIIFSSHIKSCYWDFGDGESSYEISPIHIYKRAGKYTVILVVNGDEGIDFEKKINYISVSDSEKHLVSSEIIGWLDAGKYVGQYKTVEGTIVDTHFGANIKGQPTFLNFYKPYKDFFKCLIWGSDREKFINVFPPNPETYLLNKTVRVTGLIEEYPDHSGIPEIILRYPYQVEVVVDN